jgi:plasmid stabilization system protein ParE
LKVTYADEAIADILDAITYLVQRSPGAAANLDADIAACIERLASRQFDGPVSRLRSGAVVQSWAVPPFRIYYQRHPDELLIVRVYHQARRPITR